MKRYKHTNIDGSVSIADASNGLASIELTVMSMSSIACANLAAAIGGRMKDDDGICRIIDIAKAEDADKRADEMWRAFSLSMAMYKHGVDVSRNMKYGAGIAASELLKASAEMLFEELKSSYAESMESPKTCANAAKSAVERAAHKIKRAAETSPYDDWRESADAWILAAQTSLDSILDLEELLAGFTD